MWSFYIHEFLRSIFSSNKHLTSFESIVSGKSYSKISTASGFMKENNLVGFPLGTLKRIEMPRFMNGFVKSMTASRAKLMVIAPNAMSAFPSINSVSKMADVCVVNEDN